MEEELLVQAKNNARNDLLDEWVDELLKDAEIVYPPAVVESELDTMVSDFQDQITRSGWQWEDFLKLQGESEESLRENWKEGATERIERGLALREFSEIEYIQVTSSDVDEILEERLAQYGDNAELREQIRNVMSQGQALDAMRNDAHMRKVIDRIEDIFTGNAPDLEEIEQMRLQDDDEEE
jgi:trigger factor